MGSLKNKLLKALLKFEQQKTVAEQATKPISPSQSDDNDLSFQQAMIAEGFFPAKRDGSKTRIDKATHSISGTIAQAHPGIQTRSQEENSKGSPTTYSKSKFILSSTSNVRKLSDSRGCTVSPPKDIPNNIQVLSPSTCKNSKCEAQTKPLKQAVCKLSVTEGEIKPGPWMKNGMVWEGYLKPDVAGIREQLVNEDNAKNGKNDVAIGLDFGTAYTKVVIGDHSLDTAYAVPFSSQMTGINAYLLPCRVWLQGNRYSLEEQGIPKQRLKLNLLREAEDSDAFFNAAAYLALVIRHSRGWLFSQHKDIYNSIFIYWSLTLGLPAQDYNNNEMVEKFKNLAEKAWIIASSSNEEITVNLVKSICINGDLNNDDCVIDVMPELSAQIFGFLRSSRFDPNGKNIFFMIDIGAGTVDSSIFHVKRNKNKKWIFIFYANFVAPNGAINLHDGRLSFIQEGIKNIGLYEKNESILREAQQISYNLSDIPKSIHQYFTGIKFNKDYDEEFYKNRYKNQVMNITLRESEKYIDKKILKGSTLFLCGGGSRIPLYRKIVNDLNYHKNASWLNFILQDIEIPQILKADNVRKTDFDRLSVAFGLSFNDASDYKKSELYEHKSVDMTSVLHICQQCGQRANRCTCD